MTQNFERWKRASFPVGSADHRVDQLHADLARWDAEVADLAIPLHDGRSVVSPVLDVLGEVKQLVQEIQSAQRDVASYLDSLALYREYALMLHAVVEEIQPLYRSGFDTSS